MYLIIKSLQPPEEIEAERFSHSLEEARKQQLEFKPRPSGFQPLSSAELPSAKVQASWCTCFYLVIISR